jgi:hypothetical protein
MPKVRKIFVFDERYVKMLNDICDERYKSKCIEKLIEKEYKRINKLKREEV